jgi:2,5-diamino-6-(ribosylamino)-4(3H)-pyrimidinone 5'-phosphate reductase
MDRPSVTIHNTLSVDGRLTGFPVDLGLHYEVADSSHHDAALTGSATLLAAARAQGIDLAGDDPDQPVPPPVPDDPRPWLVIVDSRARVSRLAWLRGQPFWRDVLVLCSQTTPAQHLTRLRRHHVEYLVAGADRVDLAAALHLLADRYRVHAVRVDAGGTLNGALMRAGLVDELSIIIAPHLAGADAATVPLLTGPGPDRARLTLLAVDHLRDGHLWLRYRLQPGPSPDGADTPAPGCAYPAAGPTGRT